MVGECLKSKRGVVSPTVDKDYLPEMADSRKAMKLNSSSLVRGRSQVASSNTSLMVTGSTWVEVDSIVFCLFLFLLLYVSI